jgi:predicted dehydrogenase
MRSFGIGIIGYGGIGRVHALGYRSIPTHYALPADTVRVVGVAETNAAKAEAAAREIGCGVWTDDYRALLARDDIDVVTVAVPNNVHEAIVIAAAEAGKHIFCEKPLAMTVAEGRRILAAVEKAGVKAQVNFNFRFYPAIQHARKLIEAGFLGRVFSYRACFYRSSYVDPGVPLSWRLSKTVAGGGALFDLGSHVLDSVYFLLGEFGSVAATAETLIAERPIAPGADEKGPVDVDDIVLMQAHMANGALGSIEISRMGTGITNEMTIEIFGDRGAIRFYSHDPGWLHVYDVSAPRQGYQKLQTGGRFEDQVAPHWTMPPGFGETFAAGQYQLLRAIDEGRRPSPDVADALHVQAVMAAVLRSSDEGRRVGLSEVSGDG